VANTRDDEARVAAVRLWRAVYPTSAWWRPASASAAACTSGPGRHGV